jgi:hypothetical protein
LFITRFAGATALLFLGGAAIVDSTDKKESLE